MSFEPTSTGLTVLHGPVSRAVCLPLRSLLVLPCRSAPAVASVESQMIAIALRNM